MNNLLVKMQFGSHIYGTNLPTSDTDYKAIYLPSPREILLGKAKETIVESTKKSSELKNSKDDVDVETFSLKQYVKLLLEGQTVAMDILFTPEEFYQPLEDGDFSTMTWRTLKENKDKFLHSGYTSFAGYCKQQANKYGVKGSRVNAVRKSLEFLKSFDLHERLSKYAHLIEEFVLYENDEFLNIVQLQNAQKTGLEPYLEVCGRKLAFHATIKYAVGCLQEIFDNYGARALQAEKNEGVDWKALNHAVRIINQSKELLSTGNVTFPRPEKDTLLKIRKGELPYKEVAEMIEVGLAEMEARSLKSPLPKTPDTEWANDFVFQVYKDWIVGEKV